jgi:hypothetical protein
METHSEAKPESLSPAPQICPGFLLRDLRVPVVNIRAKQTQFPAGAGWDEAPGAWDAGQIVQNEPNLVGSSMRNKANWPLGGYRAGRPTHEEPRGQSCETNPISRRDPVGRGRYPIVPVFYHSTISDRGRLGKTDPTVATSGRCRAGACPEHAEGTPNPRSGRGQAHRRAGGKVDQFRGCP